MNDEKKSVSRSIEAIGTKNETLWRHKEMLNKVNGTVKAAFYLQITLTILNVLAAMASTYMYSSASLNARDSFTIGFFQIIMSLALFVPAYFALGKGITATIIMTMAHVTVIILGVLFMNIFFVCAGIIGAAAYIAELVALKKYSYLKEQEGFPYFNERLEDSVINTDYNPQSYVAPEMRSGEMDELTPGETLEYNDLMTRNVSDVLQVCRPQMDSISVGNVAEDEELSDVALSSPDEVKAHMEKIIKKKRSRDEIVDNILNNSDKEPKNVR